jgi:hypothetical protein
VNARQHYAKLSKMRQSAMMACGSQVLALAKVVGRQILDTSIMISFKQLLNLAPNLMEYMKSQVFLELTHKAYHQEDV